MKPALPMSRSRPQLHTGFTDHATEPIASKNYKWTSKTFPDINVRMMTDSQSEYVQPCDDQDEQIDYDYEYVTSSSLEDLRHVKICPAKPINMQSVYADKRCLQMMSTQPFLKGGLPPSQIPQADLRQQSMLNMQPSTQYKSSNMQRGKKSCDSHAVPGPTVDRTVKPFTTVKVPVQTSDLSPILDYKQPTRPPPRPPKSISKELQQLPPKPSHTHSFSGPDHLPHSTNKPSTTHSENNIGLHRSKQNEALIPRNGTDFRSSPDIIMPMRQQHSLPFKPTSKSLPTASSLHQTTHMPDPSRIPKLHFPRLPAKDLERNIWYVGACDRYKAEEALRIKNKNGAFLVRDSSKGIPDKPYVLLVYYRFKVYSIQIRYLEDTKQYALGSGLRGHDIFYSVPDIIEIHKNIPLRLIDRRDQSGSQMEQCILTVPLTLH